MAAEQSTRLNGRSNTKNRRQRKEQREKRKTEKRTEKCLQNGKNSRKEQQTPPKIEEGVEIECKQREKNGEEPKAAVTATLMETIEFGALASEEKEIYYELAINENNFSIRSLCFS